MLCIDGSDIHNREYVPPKANNKDKRQQLETGGQGGAAKSANTQGGSSLWSTLSNKFLGVKTKKRLVSSIVDF